VLNSFCSRLVGAGHGPALQGRARQYHGPILGPKISRLGRFQFGCAMLGNAWQCSAWQALAWRGAAIQYHRTLSSAAAF
jgi:hypothetical protein